jgi:hypothetical protein
MKTCTLCKIEKPLTEYPPRKSQKNGLHAWCKPCLKIKKLEDYQRNRAERSAQQVEYRKHNRVANMARAKAWADANPERVKEVKRAYHAANRDSIAKKASERYQANKAERTAKNARWAAANYERLRAYQVSYHKTRRKEDPIYAAKVACRCRVASAFRRTGFRKGSPTEELLGCDFKTLHAHIESLFQEGMTWANRGFEGWHIDHKIPLASATDEASLRALCHYKNLQPLWASENLKKGAKMPENV